MNVQLIESELLKLPTSERARIAGELLRSLDDMSEAEIEAEWMLEAKRRSDEIDRGQAKLVTADELRREVRELLK